MYKKEIVYFDSNPTLKGMAEIFSNIVYSEKTGQKLTLLRPWIPEGDTRKFPLIVFVQGSAWTTPNLEYEIPQLSELARKGYAIATVCHRDSSKGYPVPAFLQDVKTAIRYLRANAEKYRIDPERVGIWGTSSGGNTSLLVAVTGDFPEYKTEEYKEVSDSIKFAVSCFGPTDMLNRMQVFSENMPQEMKEMAKRLAGDRNVAEVAAEMSPLLRLKEGVTYPPMLLLHGDADKLVPYEQSVAMYERLLELGQDAQMVCVRGADHEGDFWSQDVIDYIHRYIEERI